MELKNKNVYFLGDSITEGVGASDLNNAFVTVFQRLTDANVINYGVSGTRFAEQKNEFEKSFSETFLSRAKRMKKDADILVCFGGTNDFGHGDSEFGNENDHDLYTFTGATSALFEYFKENFKNAKIVIIPPISRTTENNNEINDIGLKQKKSFKDVRNYEIKKAKELGFYVLDIYETKDLDATDELKNKKYFLDGLHPNDLGHKYLAEKIKEYLETI